MRKLARARRLLWSLAVAGAACSDGSPGTGNAEVATFAPVSATPRRVAATGRIEGWREADVTSKLPGRIVRFEYEEGDPIEAGAAVIRLEDRDLRARVRAAEARTREAMRVLKRSRALHTEKIASMSQRDHAESEYQVAAAVLDEARVTLGYATIRAPFSGTLVRRYKELGESATTGSGPDPLFRIADLTRLKVTAEVPEIDIAEVRTGQSAEVFSEAYPGEPFRARVRRVSLAVGRKQLRSDDPREQLYAKVVEVELEVDEDLRLKSGMTVDVLFRTSAEVGP